MIAREAVLNDPEVARTLQTRFVPLAVDNVGNPNITPAEKEFLLSFDSGIKASTLGFSVFTPGGKKLGSAYTFDPGQIRELLRKALLDFKPEDPSGNPIRGGQEVEPGRSPPDGGLVLYVTWKTLSDGKPEGDLTTNYDKWAKVFQNALGSDRLWVRKDEALALARAEFPESLKRRIARFHLRYVLGGDGKTFDVAVRSGKLMGSFPPDGSGAHADVLGHLESKGSKVTRLDFLIKGWAKKVADHGFSASLQVVPAGKAIPAALYFELADATEGLARVLPRRSNDESYLK